MLVYQFTSFTAFLTLGVVAVKFPRNTTPDDTAQSTNSTSDMIADEKNLVKENKTFNLSDEPSSHEQEIESEEVIVKDKKFLDEALRTVLNPEPMMLLSNDVVESFESKLDKIENESVTLEGFMQEMDKLSLEVCKTSQEALWSYVTDINNERKKNNMVRIAAEEDEIKKQYWAILKKKFWNEESLNKDAKLKRKVRIIRERGTNVQMPQTKQRGEIDTMQRIWSRVTVCAYNYTTCNTEDSVRTMSDVITVFRTSNDSKEQAYYWKAYRDATGKKIRPVFKDYVARMNNVARLDNFTDAGDMWRYAFEDDNFTQTVDRLWNEIKPIYDLLHDYVRAKLKLYYKDDLKSNDNLIPAHILGNLWAQEWQAIYTKVAPYPDQLLPKMPRNHTVQSRGLFTTVDNFLQSLGFESAKDSFQDIKETTNTANCLPSSHDMCDGINYKIKWCGEKITDIGVGLSRAARLLGHIQYFKLYRHQEPLFRDGPNPAFHDAISDIIAVQVTTPEHLKFLGVQEGQLSREVSMNHLVWLALEKFPLMAYAYVLDKWRWDVFGNSSMENWNQHWWNLRIKETGISPPVPRNESDLDPAAKYHVVSHVQYITYLISHVLEFQILQSLCQTVNHTGPLYKCSLFGENEAGTKLSYGMSLGASVEWTQVLEAITGETELSTAGILEYFSELKDFLQEENVRLAKLFSESEDMDQKAPIIVGAIVVLLTIIIVVMYCAKKHNVNVKMFSVCGLSKNGSLDIVTNETPKTKNGKSNEIDAICEDKV